MFVVVQFPIADMRQFSNAAPGKQMLSPRWPPSTDIPSQFLRLFGGAGTRFRSVDQEWGDETSYCHAHRALRFSSLPGTPKGVETDSWKRQVRCAFRRTLSDGIAVSRIEIGFSFLPFKRLRQMWQTWDATVDSGKDPYALATQGLNLQTDPEEVIGHIMQIGTETPHLFPDGETRTRYRPLVRQGRALAELYFRGTTQMLPEDAKKVGRSWQSLVTPGSPVMLIECANDAIEKLPQSYKRIDGVDTGGIPMAFGRPRSPLGNLDVWLLGHSKAKSAALRNLRICLLRLHSQRQVLAAVLDRLQSGEIRYQPELDSADRIERYINDATYLINKQEWKDIGQSKILAALTATDAASALVPGPRLSDALSGMQLQIKRKAEKFATRTQGSIYVAPGATLQQRIGEVTTTNITFGSGATVSGNIVVAGSIQNSFNRITGSGGLSEDAKAQMELLLKQIAEASTKMPDSQAKELADNAEILTKEVSSEKPRRRWYDISVEGLKEAAEAVGEVGKPILKTVAALVPLLAGLFA